MIDAWKRMAASLALAGASVIASAQIPDLFSSFEMGGRGMGMGGSIYSNASDTTASYWNPAGLAHVKNSSFEVSMRNRPSNNTSLSGNFDDPIPSNSPQYGRNSISFAGVAFPMGQGTLGISYATGGYARQLKKGNGLVVDPDQNITANVDTRDTFVNEFVTLAYGMPMGESMTVGAGVVFGRQSIMERSNIVLFQNGSQIGGGTNTDDAESANGVGGIVGVQFQPKDSNTSFGVSFRTPIRVTGYDIFSSFSNTIPGRVEGGILFRKDGLRGGRDYLIGGIDVAYYLACNSGLDLQRRGHVSAGVGFEYNLAQAWGYLGLRAGAHSTQSGGGGFENRTVFTFGLGVRPSNAKFSLDLSGASGTGTSRPDFAVTLGYALGR
jgi:hypothetical protein